MAENPFEETKTRSQKSEALRRERIVMAEMEKMLAVGTEADLKKKLKDLYGITPESPRYAEILRIWRGL